SRRLKQPHIGSCKSTRGKTISRSSLHPRDCGRNNCLYESAHRADIVLTLKPPWRRRFFFTNGGCRGVEMILESPNNGRQDQREAIGGGAVRVVDPTCWNVLIGTVIDAVEC